MSARLIGVVGPSGVGKDSVMAALAARVPGLRLVRRVITRPSDAGGETFEGVSEADFAARVAAGDFGLWWRAHGMAYGIPHSEVEDRPDGEIALVNLSRAVLDEARARYPGFAVLSLTAAPETLAHRLAGRGRESEAEIAARLARAGYVRPEGADVIEISNDGPLDETVAAVLQALSPERAKH
ncbi:phosphonate metabolism protein/1,5-bisphosphokinase (PRPP-forming) PhnN [Shimia sp. FJ5]|uniref:phosphonate metabolism protein/1,5-bisphosphokinase (PRPP-forming) PhnN n=1 Tax=Shimia sp. FJ5 TaxID=3079054 RepID=UPI002605E707|nr:phosphonate metabolism protein/1,5-bisphosphokinase (PRPP-forming) PhnN [Shimia sp. FJ5]MDV4143473.1 phosphonate metabolism protein/1,5-bisphosphokinase (PRPP-forming) PhnN [Shimia sp. FJ5]